MCCTISLYYIHASCKNNAISNVTCDEMHCLYVIVPTRLYKGVAFQYILYSDVHLWSKFWQKKDYHGIAFHLWLWVLLLKFHLTLTILTVHIKEIWWVDCWLYRIFQTMVKHSEYLWWSMGIWRRDSWDMNIMLYSYTFVGFSTVLHLCTIRWVLIGVFDCNNKLDYFLISGWIPREVCRSLSNDYWLLW